jgi:hypothetical protein
MTNIFEETYEAMEAARKAYSEAANEDGKDCRREGLR